MRLLVRNKRGRGDQRFPLFCFALLFFFLNCMLKARPIASQMQSKKCVNYENIHHIVLDAGNCQMVVQWLLQTTRFTECPINFEAILIFQFFFNVESKDDTRCPIINGILVTFYSQIGNI